MTVAATALDVNTLLQTVIQGQSGKTHAIEQQGFWKAAQDLTHLARNDIDLARGVIVPALVVHCSSDRTEIIHQTLHSIANAHPSLIPDILPHLALRHADMMHSLFQTYLHSRKDVLSAEQIEMLCAISNAGEDGFKPGQKLDVKRPRRQFNFAVNSSSFLYALSIAREMLPGIIGSGCGRAGDVFYLTLKKQYRPV